MKTRSILTAVALCGAAAAAGPRLMQADILYNNTFQGGSYWPEWSNNQTSENANYTRFLGRFTNQGVTLTLSLPALPPPPPDFEIPDDEGGDEGEGEGGGGGGGPSSYWTYVVAFDFHCIDSWDGYESTHGVDRLQVRINNAVAFDESFANQHLLQSYEESPDLGRAHLGYDSRWLDSSYRLTIPFLANAGTTTIRFEGIGLLGPLNDESWGLDDVQVSTMLVPGPGCGALLGCAGVIGMRRRRPRAA